MTYEQLLTVPLQAIIERLPRAHFNNYHLVIKELLDQPSGDQSGREALASLFAFLSFQVHEDDRIGASVSPLFKLSNGQASFVPEDLSSEDAAAVWQFVQGIEHPGLRAKLADMLWVSRKLKNENHLAALQAIDAYLAHAREAVPENILFLKRAGGIARELGKAGQESLKKVCAEGRRHILATKIEDTHGLTHDLYALCLKAQPSEFEALAARAQEVAEFHENGKNYDLAAPYLELARAYYAQVGDADRANGLRDRLVECHLAKDAFFRDAGNPFVAVAALKEAIRLSQGIVTTEELLRLRTFLSAAQKECLSKLRLVQTEVPDGLKMAETAKVIIASKGSAEDALFTLATIVNIVDLNSLRAYVAKVAKQSPLFFLATPVQLDSKGRTAAKPTSKDELERFEMLRMLQYLVQMQGGLLIGPAREEFAARHSISANGIAGLVLGNPLVPEDRVHLVARALKLGLDGDLTTSLYLLVPQLENGVRAFLESVGVATSRFVGADIEEEKTLGGYLAHEALRKAMGESLTFTLEFVFTEKAGVNLRNLLAHGLYSPAAFQTPYALYAWWIILRLCLIPLPEAGKAEPLDPSPLEGGAAQPIPP